MNRIEFNIETGQRREVEVSAYPCKRGPDVLLVRFKSMGWLRRNFSIQRQRRADCGRRRSTRGRSDWRKTVTNGSDAFDGGYSPF